MYKGAKAKRPAEEIGLGRNVVVHYWRRKELPGRKFSAFGTQRQAKKEYDRLVKKGGERFARLLRDGDVVEQWGDITLRDQWLERNPHVVHPKTGEQVWVEEGDVKQERPSRSRSRRTAPRRARADLPEVSTEKTDEQLVREEQLAAMREVGFTEAQIRRLMRASNPAEELDTEFIEGISLAEAKRTKPFKEFLGQKETSKAFVPALDLHEKAGLTVTLDIHDWGEPGQVFASRSVSAPKALESEITAMIFNRPHADAEMSSLLTRSTRHGGWQLTRFARRIFDPELRPVGHSDLDDLGQLYSREKGPYGDEHLRQIIFRDGTVMVRKGATEIAYNPGKPRRKKKPMKVQRRSRKPSRKRNAEDPFLAEEEARWEDLFKGLSRAQKDAILTALEDYTKQESVTAQRAATMQSLAKKGLAIQLTHSPKDGILTGDGRQMLWILQEPTVSSVEEPNPRKKKPMKVQRRSRKRNPPAGSGMFDFGDGNGPVAAAQHINPNGSVGGWVASTAHVDNTATVFKKALVYGDATVHFEAKIFGESKVFDRATVGDRAMINRAAEVYDSAKVLGDANVRGKAKVYGDAIIKDAKIGGSARVYEGAQVRGATEVSGAARIYGKAWVQGHSVKVTGQTQITGRAQVLDGASILGHAIVTGTAEVRGDAQISGRANVFGDALISENAKVGGEAHVGGDARVVGDADVFGDAVLRSGVYTTGKIYEGMGESPELELVAPADLPIDEGGEITGEQAMGEWIQRGLGGQEPSLEVQRFVGGEQPDVFGGMRKHMQSEVQKDWNPTKRKKMAAQQLIDRCRKLWESYDRKPLKRSLVALTNHLERMKDSKSVRVKAERSRCLRMVNKEWKLQGWAKPKAPAAKKKVAKKKATRRRGGLKKNYAEEVPKREPGGKEFYAYRLGDDPSIIDSAGSPKAAAKMAWSYSEDTGKGFAVVINKESFGLGSGWAKLASVSDIKDGEGGIRAGWGLEFGPYNIFESTVVSQWYELGGQDNPERRKNARKKKVSKKRPTRRKKNPGGFYVQVKDLPEALQGALSEYTRRDVQIIPDETFSPSEARAGHGAQGYVTVVNLVTGESKTGHGDWGGVGLGTMAQAAEGMVSIDIDESEVPIPPNGAVVIGTIGARNFARVKVHPDTLNQMMLPEAVALEPDEQVALDFIIGLNTGGRKDAFNELRRSFPSFGQYEGDNPILQRLRDKGMVKINKRGSVSVTTDGRNNRKFFGLSVYQAVNFLKEEGYESNPEPRRKNARKKKVVKKKAGNPKRNSGFAHSEIRPGKYYRERADLVIEVSPSDVGGDGPGWAGRWHFEGGAKAKKLKAKIHWHREKSDAVEDAVQRAESLGWAPNPKPRKNAKKKVAKKKATRTAAKRRRKNPDVPTDREEFITRYMFTTSQGLMAGPKVIRKAIGDRVRIQYPYADRALRRRMVDAAMSDDKGLKWLYGSVPSAVGRGMADLVEGYPGIRDTITEAARETVGPKAVSAGDAPFSVEVSGSRWVGSVDAREISDFGDDRAAAIAWRDEMNKVWREQLDNPKPRRMGNPHPDEYPRHKHDWVFSSMEGTSPGRKRGTLFKCHVCGMMGRSTDEGRTVRRTTPKPRKKRPGENPERRKKARTTKDARSRFLRRNPGCDEFWIARQNFGGEGNIDRYYETREEAEAGLVEEDSYVAPELIRVTKSKAEGRFDEELV